MPKFEPTDEQRKTVERAAGFGLPQDKICKLVVSDRTSRSIDDDTLRRALRLNLSEGRRLPTTPWFARSMSRGRLLAILRLGPTWPQTGYSRPSHHAPARQFDGISLR